MDNSTPSFPLSSQPPWLKRLLMPVQYMKGCGPFLSKTLGRLGVKTVWDLLCYKPTVYKERHYIKTPDLSYKGQLVTLVLTATHHTKPRQRQPHCIQCVDETGQAIDLIFFNAYPGIYQQMPLHQPRVVSGELDFFMNKPKIIHPHHMGDLTTLAEASKGQFYYSLTAGISQKQLHYFKKQARQLIEPVPEWLPESCIETFHFNPMHEALKESQKKDFLNPDNKNRMRLAFDELLSYALALNILRYHDESKTHTMCHITASVFPSSIYKVFPFDLTHDQKDAIHTIFQDITSSKRMVRLLQGDVGSGKTAVAFAILALMAREGYQGVLMAPTEILARQHAQTLEVWAKALELNLVILTGQDKGKSRQDILKAIKTGHASIIVGTHALFQENVLFHRLGLVVIDEQHRFGVGQRLKLLEKGVCPHLLSMTATPIPRSLLLTLYGDLDVSNLREKPNNRKPVVTSVIASKRLGEIKESLPRALLGGHKVFWVCPLVDKSESLTLTSATERYEDLQTVLGHKVACIHGKLKGDEKEKIIQQFKQGDVSVLVATTVVEVGVDVSDATMMVIEHAERFGLAQLHQLRGRVGRGEYPGTCILIYSHPLSAIGRERLHSLKNSNDGFELAETDLRLRGGGTLTGYRQSGIPYFKFADLCYHQNLLKSATDMAKRIGRDDPTLLKPNNQALRHLLWLYGHESLNLLISG